MTMDHALSAYLPLTLLLLHTGMKRRSHAPFTRSGPLHAPEITAVGCAEAAVPGSSRAHSGSSRVLLSLVACRLLRVLLPLLAASCQVPQASGGCASVVVLDVIQLS